MKTDVKGVNVCYREQSSTFNEEEDNNLSLCSVFTAQELFWVREIDPPSLPVLFFYSIGGLILDKTVTDPKFEGMAVFTPVINGRLARVVICMLLFIPPLSSQGLRYPLLSLCRSLFSSPCSLTSGSESHWSPLHPCLLVFWSISGAK